MNVVMGIDVGVRKVAVAVLKGDIMEVHIYVADAALPRAKQLMQLMIFVAELANQTKAHIAFIEESLLGNNTRYSIQLAQVVGAVSAGLAEEHVEVHLVNVSTWKKAIIGKGNAKKDEVRRWVDVSHPAYTELCDGDQDRYDASCVALYGQRLVSLATDMAAHR